VSRFSSSVGQRCHRSSSTIDHRSPSKLRIRSEIEGIIFPWNEARHDAALNFAPTAATGCIGNPWERKNLQESHPAVSDGTIRYHPCRAWHIKLHWLSSQSDAARTSFRCAGPDLPARRIRPRKPTLCAPFPFPSHALPSSCITFGTLT